MNEKYKAALEALEELFGDTSVLPEETMKYLESVRDHVDNWIETLRPELSKSE